MLALRTILAIALSGILLCPRLLSAQAIELSGGASSLYESQGGDITIHAQSYDLTTGVGLLNGQLLEGVHVARATSFGQLLAGDFRFPFRLPTDIFDSSHFLLARGFGARLVQPTSEYLGFAGVSSVSNSSPFFEGSKGSDPTAILMAAKTVRKDVDLFSDTVIASKFTQLAAVNWSPGPKLHFALTGGIGSNSPYFASSAVISRPRYDAQVGYFASGSDFRRAFVPSPLLAEPTGANVQVTVRPAPFLAVTGSHQHFLVPATDGTDPTQSEVDEASISVRIHDVQLNASAFASTYTEDTEDVVSNHSFTLTATRNFSRRYQVMTSLLASRPFETASTSSFVTNLSEALTNRITVSQNITVSNGNANVNFGGSFLSNLIEASAGYETFYIPAQITRPLQQSLILDAKLTLFGRFVLHGASVVDPTGKMRYTADARTLLIRNHIVAQASEQIPMGDYVISGHVLTASGTPVDGAALQIDEAVLYTDSEGRFLLRENRRRLHSIKVLTAEFLNGGRWEVVSDPGTLPSVLEASQQSEPVIVLRHQGPS